MMTAASSNSAMSARLKIVEEHVSLENAHDLEGIMGTFGAAARHDDEPWGAHYAGETRCARSTRNCSRTL
ncbi:MAG TPA: hypothetical protein VGI22_12435 [Xanthobacteraceae bacterium]|jgi:hypothetical protein